MLIQELREWGIFLIDVGILWILILEYNYDAAKDAKKQRRTKTTKKTTTLPTGEVITDEQTEMVESKGHDNEKIEVK
jgi:hypothetical protein